jgi:hypothetical protein
MDAQRTPLQEEKERLLERLAEIEVEQQRQAGMFKAVPHYSVLEQAAHGLGQELSRVAQRRAAREVAAVSKSTSACPGCGQECSVAMSKRTVTSLDGPVEMIEPVAHCPACRRDFFPSA